jgi:hypothetical protein
MPTTEARNASAFPNARRTARQPFIGAASTQTLEVPRHLRALGRVSSVPPWWAWHDHFTCYNRLFQLGSRFFGPTSVRNVARTTTSPLASVSVTGTAYSWRSDVVSTGHSHVPVMVPRAFFT